MGDELFVTVWFTDGHRQHWQLPDGQTPDQALEELRQVIVTGQWFRAPDSTKVYSPHAIVAVDVAPRREADSPSVAFRLGEVVGDAISPDHGPAARTPRDATTAGVAMARDRLSHHLGRTPTLDELCEAIGEPPEAVAEGLAAHRAYTAQTLDRPLRGAGGSGEDRKRTDQALVCEEPGYEVLGDDDLLWRAMRRLPPRERQVVAWRVYNELTQSENLRNRSTARVPGATIRR